MAHMSVAEGALRELTPAWEAGTPGGEGRVAASDQLVPFQWNAAGLNVWLPVCSSPTAVTSEGRKLATPVNPAAGLAATRCQLVPFQCSASFLDVLACSSYTLPTAQRSVAETMLRETSEGNRPEVDGPGLGTRVQAVPSQCTISVWLGAYGW